MEYNDEEQSLKYIPVPDQPAFTYWHVDLSHRWLGAKAYAQKTIGPTRLTSCSAESRLILVNLETILKDQVITYTVFLSKKTSTDNLPCMRILLFALTLIINPIAYFQVLMAHATCQQYWECWPIHPCFTLASKQMLGMYVPK